MTLYDRWGGRDRVDRWSRWGEISQQGARGQENFKSSCKHTTLILHIGPPFHGENIMHTLPRTSTTEMEVTSIRLERELKERLKELAGNQGYQALIRDLLWNYVQQKSGEYRQMFTRSDIRASINATAQQEERCALTGQLIRPNEPMLLGLTMHGEMLPLSIGSLAG